MTKAITPQSPNAALLSGVSNRDRRYQIQAFIKWLGKHHWLTVDLAEYRDHLLTQRTRVGAPLSPVTINKYLEAIYGHYQTLTRSNALRDDLYAAYDALPDDADARRRWSAKEFVDETMTRILNNANPERLRVDVVQVMHKTDDEDVRLTLDEVQQTLRTFSSKTVRDRAIFALLAATGLRVDEARVLTVDDLRQSYDGRPALVVRKGKGNKQRVVLYIDELDPVFVYVDEYLDRYGVQSGPVFQGFNSRWHDQLNGKPLTSRALQKAVESATPPKPVSAHRLRHTYARILADLGYSDEFIQEQLGHESVRTTAGYIGGRDDIRLKELESR